MNEKNTRTCPITQVILLLSDRWTMLIMRALMDGPKRFTELERWLESISTRTLTLKLSRLIEEGMVKKTNAGVYQLTAKGSGLKIIQKAMIKYSQLYLKHK